MASSNDRPPAPAYFPSSASSPLHPPKALYDGLRALSEERGELVRVDDVLIPPRSGRAWKVKKEGLFRLSTPEGPQVGDLNIWSAHNPRERFWASRTRQLHGSHVTTYDRLWSNLPYMRPLCGIVDDGCADALAERGREARRDERGGVSKWGGRCHDLLGTRCDPYVSHMLTGAEYDFHCHSNLLRAVLPHALTEPDIHDVLNVFQVTGLDSQGRYFMEASPAGPASYVTFFAETDLLCALSTCPGGDLSAWGWHQAEEVGGAAAAVTEEAEGNSGKGEVSDMKSTCRPIRVEVFEIAEGVKGEVLRGWKEPGVSAYKGCHGMTIPGGEA